MPASMLPGSSPTDDSADLSLNERVVIRFCELADESESISGVVGVALREVVALGDGLTRARILEAVTTALTQAAETDTSALDR